MLIFKSDFSYYTKFMRNYIRRIISPTKPDLKKRIIDFLLFKKIIRCYKSKLFKKTHTRSTNFCFHPKKSFAKILIRNVYIIKIYAFIYIFQVGRWKESPFFPDSIRKSWYSRRCCSFSIRSRNYNHSFRTIMKTFLVFHKINYIFIVHIRTDFHCY